MASEAIADIVAEYRRDYEDMKAKRLYLPTAEYLRRLLDRIEAAAKRAYNDIDSAVCGIEDASHYDIDGVRMAMDKTIGDYYE